MERYPSRNDATFRYSGTVEEFFYDKVRALNRLEDIIAESERAGGGEGTAAAGASIRDGVLKAEAERDRLAQQAREKHVPLYRLLTAAHTRKMCSKLVRYGPHFRVLPEMKLSYLKHYMFGFAGGVSSCIGIIHSGTDSEY